MTITDAYYQGLTDSILMVNRALDQGLTLEEAFDVLKKTVRDTYQEILDREVSA